MKNKIKILHVLNNFDIVNGITTTCSVIFKEIDKSNEFELSLALGNKSESDISKLNIKNIFIDKSFDYTKRNILNFIKAFYFSFKLIRNNNFDIIHTHHFYHSFIFSCLKIFGKFKVVRTIHGLIPNKGVLPHYYADEFISVSRGNLELLKILKPKLISKIILIHNSHDLKLGKSKNHFVKMKFLVASRLTHEKGIHILLKAISILPKINRNFTISIAGNGELEEEVKIFCVKNKIIFLGTVKDIPKIINHYDCLISPIIGDEEKEGFPSIIAKSAMSKLAVISSDFTGYNYYLNNKNSFIYNKYNPDELAKTILKVANNRNIAIRKSEIIFKDFKLDFDKKENFDKLKQLYFSLL